MRLFWTCLTTSLITFMLFPSTQSDAEITSILETRIGLESTGFGEMAWDGTNFWVEGGGSLSKRVGEGHSNTDWLSFEQMDGWGNGSISARWAHGDTIIVSWVYYDFYVAINAEAPHGDGVSISLNGGETWSRSDITDLFPDRAGFAVPNRYTTIWDIAVTSGTIWCSTTSGYLLRSKDMGRTWENILPYVPAINSDPNVIFQFENPNHHGQCVDAYGDTLWVGTFQGMNLSVDDGNTWVNFSWPKDGSGNPNSQIPGNFPVAVEHTVVGGKTHVWVASQAYYGVGRYGICHTSDNGNTWKYETYLDAESCPWNIAFGHSSASNPSVSDSMVFVATGAGLLFSSDLGEHWETMMIRETDTLFWNEDQVIGSVLVVADTLWATSADGIARTSDWGEHWTLFGEDPVFAEQREAVPSGITFRGNFPNPFNQSTSIEFSLPETGFSMFVIYDMIGRKVQTLAAENMHSGNHVVVWDGKDENGKYVSSGMYFFYIRQGNQVASHRMILEK